MIYLSKMKRVKGFPDYFILTNGQIWSDKSHKELKSEKRRGVDIRVLLYVIMANKNAY